MPLIAVTAADIDAAGTTVDCELPLAWLAAELSDAEATAATPGHLTARLARAGGEEIVVRGKVAAELSVPCARCLDPTRVVVDAELSLLLAPAPTPPGLPQRGKPRGQNGAPKGAPKPKEDEYEFTSEEAEHDTYDGETVVLDGFVREALLLELPNFPLCSEACPGIRPAPEGDPAEATPRVDPRFAALSALRDRLPAQPSKKPKKDKE